MFNQNKLTEILKEYREDFHKPNPNNKNQSHWEAEQYKWIAVKHFQDNWDIDAPDFAAMLSAATAKLSNLLASINYFARGMIIELSKADPEAVRGMFKKLYDENLSFSERIEFFISEAEALRKKYGEGKWKSHYQDYHAISTYLWSRYPDSYYIYKYSVCKDTAVFLESDFKPRTGNHPDTLINFISFYNELKGFISKDQSTTDMLNSALTSECYSDSEYHTLTSDIGFYISQKLKDKKSTDNEKSNAAFLRWFNPIIIALRELGGSGTPAQVKQRIAENEKLSFEEINETRGKNNVNKFSNDVAFARSYLVKGGYIDGTERGLWTLTEKGKAVDMTDELASAIFKGVSSSYRTPYNNTENSLGDTDSKLKRYWLFAPGENANKWQEFLSEGIMAIGWDELGDLSAYTSKSDIADSLRTLNNSNSSFKNSTSAVWEFVYKIKPGDIIFAKKGKSIIVGCGIVESDYEHDENRESYRNIRKVKWTHNGEWNHPGQAALKTLTDITSYNEYVEKLLALINEDDYDMDEEEIEIAYDEYHKEDFLSEVYVSEADYDTLCALLYNKKNVILQGPPGVGKTFATKRLAYSIMGEKNLSRVKMIQFHQSYSYEDFIMGYRPNEKGFELHKGVFYEFCKKAEEDSENDYFFIIDEINRGNLSKIFGELFMLIESDKRGIDLQLLYSDEKFSVPKNLYIIGMMNTADRGLAMLDYALRRRFAFFDIKPAFDSKGFIKYQNSLNSPEFNSLIQVIKRLNEEISSDDLLGEGFEIGHSYFCNLEDTEEATLNRIIEFEVIPLIKEYWFDDKAKVEQWSEELRRAVK